MTMHHIHVIIGPLVALVTIRLPHATCDHTTPLVRTDMTLNVNLHVTLPPLSQLPVTLRVLRPYRLELAHLPHHHRYRLSVLKIQLRLLNPATFTAHLL